MRGLRARQKSGYFDQGGLIKELKPVNLVANANPPHISTSYSLLLQREKAKSQKDKS